MDVDKLQRINLLASELRKHNFAMSSDEAYKQAEQVYESNGEQIVIEEKPIASQSSNSLATRRVELLLEMNNKKYDEEISILRTAINTLAQQLEAVRVELHNKSFEQIPSKQKEKQVELKTEVREPHPRQGNFQPSDVDIQKMFYFGSKR